MKFAVLVVLGVQICAAQSSSTISLSNGVQVRIAAGLGSPNGGQSVKIELARASGNSVYRIFRDQNGLAVFAYELAVDRTQDGDEVLITGKPVGNEFAARFPSADGGKPVSTFSSDQEFPPLRSGAKHEIGLFELAGMGLKVVDTVQVKVNQGAATPLDSGGEASGLRLRFSGLRVSIAGQSVPGAGGRVPVTGRYAMFYIPGRGGYFFSLDPPAGRNFVKAGSIDGNHLRFTFNDVRYDAVADAPILVGLNASEVWIYHDPAYKPQGNWTKDLQTRDLESNIEFFTATSDSLSWWLP